MPNLFAQFILYSYPLVVLILFRRLPRHEALIWSILGGYLFLPEQTGIDLPLLPVLNKSLIPSLVAGIMCLTLPENGVRRARKTDRASGRASQQSVAPASSRAGALAMIFVVVLFLVPFGVFMTNSDPVIAGPRFIWGIQVYDIFSMILNTGVALLPFLLARRYLATPEAQIALLKALVISGLIYSLLILVEVRLSPQLNRWIYGFHPHAFDQHIRAGGYRPMVFVGHGLRIGIFIVMSCLAAIILWRHAREAQPAQAEKAEETAQTRQPRQRRGKAQQRKKPYLLWAGWLFIILILSKTLGALLIALVLIPLVLFTSMRTQALMAGVVAMIVLIYPMLRGVDVFPVDAVYQAARSVDAERAGSLKFRLDNEDTLLAHAARKPIFGWGGWGRSRIYDTNTGKDLSVSDGSWVIAFGTTGWVGYLAQFGLLTLPIIGWAWRRRSAQASLVNSGLCLILAANLFDLIPNSSLTTLTWLVAGALLGGYEQAGRAAGPVSKPRGTQRGKRPALVHRSRAT